MNKYKEQSEDAKAQGVCHTNAECQLMYQEIPEDKRTKAVNFIKREYKEILPKILLRQKKDPEGWMGPYHMWWGMGFRNNLRENGMHEDFFGVDNLDCIQKELLWDATHG